VSLLKKVEELRSYNEGTREYSSSVLDRDEVIDIIKEAILEKIYPR
jgi:hypothetical protein